MNNAFFDDQVFHRGIAKTLNPSTDDLSFCRGPVDRSTYVVAGSGFEDCIFAGLRIHGHFNSKGAECEIWKDLSLSGLGVDWIGEWRSKDTQV